jgi:hypothetical protein
MDCVDCNSIVESHFIEPNILSWFSLLWDMGLYTTVGPLLQYDYCSSD